MPGRCSRNLAISPNPMSQGVRPGRGGMTQEKSMGERLVEPSRSLTRLGDGFDPLGFTSTCPKALTMPRRLGSASSVDLEVDVAQSAGGGEGVQPGVELFAVVGGLDLRLDRRGDRLETKPQLTQERLAFPFISESFSDGLAHGNHLRLPGGPDGVSD